MKRRQKTSKPRADGTAHSRDRRDDEHHTARPGRISGDASDTVSSDIPPADGRAGRLERHTATDSAEGEHRSAGERVRVERLVNGGAGLVRTSVGVAFVDGALPGEEIEIGPVTRRGRRPEAPIVRIHSAAPERRAPLCPLFGSCGGCDWQHLEYPAQVEWKRRILVENLDRLGGIRWDPAHVHTVVGDEYGYRSRVQVHRAADGPAGFRRRHSHQTVPVSHCPVARPALNDVLSTMTSADPLNGGSDAPGADADPASVDRIVLVEGDDCVYRSDRDDHALITVAGTRFAFHPAGFSQSNHAMLAPLAAKLRSLAGDAPVVDLYAGAGLLAATIVADTVERPVICVEPDRRNAAFIRRNVPGAQVVIDTAERALRRRGMDLIPPGACVVVDPPRGGLSRSVRRFLHDASRRIARVVYLSCDAAALARDLGGLCEHHPRDAAGGRGDGFQGPDTAFRLRELTLFDFYPQTAHIETLAVLDAPEAAEA